MCMRTNIVIDDELMSEAMRVSGAKTKRETVEVALRELVAAERRLRVLDLVGRVEMLPFDQIRPPDEGREWSS